MKLFSFSPFGFEGALVAVGADLRRGTLDSILESLKQKAED